MFWDKRSLELVDLEVGLFSISCRFKNVEDGFLWTFLEVYGLVLSGLREDFLDKLRAIRGLWEGGGGGGGVGLGAYEGTLMLSKLLVNTIRVVGSPPQ